MNFKSYLAENRKDYASLLEGAMSDIHQLANDSKDIESFTKDFFKQFGSKIKKTSDSEEWVRSLYSEMSESAVTEKTYNKKSLMKAMKADDGMIQLGNGEEYIIYAYGNGNDDNDDMWKDKTIFALDQDGEEHEIEYSDIVSYNESVVTEAKFVKDFDKAVLDAKTKDEVLKLYPNAEFFIGKSDHFFGELDDNLFFKAYYTKGQDEFEIKSIYSEKNRNYVHLYNEASVVTEAKPAGLSKKETLKVAQKFADALTKVDGMKYTVSSDYEEDSFDLDIEDQDDVDPRITGEYAGGSYNINADGSVVNMAVWNKSNVSPVYGNMDDDIKTIIKTIKNIKESVVTESKITLKRRYTENHPALAVGKSARVRNKMLEAIGDGNITQEEFDSILKELSSNGKRWSKNNARYFNVSEEGISLTRFGRKILSSITINEEEPAKTTNTKPLEMKVNEETIDNPKIWVPGGFDKAISKLPNSQITRDVVLKVAKKFKINPNDAISYVEYGWALDLQENKNTNMKTQFIYESFSSFVESLNESVDTELNEAFKSSKLRNLLTMSAAGRHGETKNLAKRFYEYTKIQLDQVGDEHILDMDMKEAFKASKDNDRVIFYVSDSEKKSPYAKDGVYQIGTGLVAISRGKDFLGSDYIRSYDRSKKGIDTLSKKGGAVGTNKEYRGYGASGLSSVKRIIEVSDRAYSISISALQSLLGSKSKRDDRAAAKAGAVAFQSDKEFKDQNRKRYETILANKASSLPLDKLVADAIDTISEQIKSGLSKGTKGKYGDLIIGLNKKGREVKVKDASNHMSNILDDYSRYCSYVKEEEDTIAKYGKSESWYAKSVKEYAKRTSDKLKQIEDMSYAW